MNINKILVPVVFLDSSLRVVQQAVYMGRHFHSEIILLHVVTPLNYPTGMLESGHAITARDLDSVPKLLNRVAEQTKADLLVTGHSTVRGHLGANGNGYSIIRDAHVPVLSV